MPNKAPTAAMVEMFKILSDVQMIDYLVKKKNIERRTYLTDDFLVTLRLAREAQKEDTFKLVVEWGNAPCPHRKGLSAHLLPLPKSKRGCGICWAELQKVGRETITPPPKTARIGAGEASGVKFGTSPPVSPSPSKERGIIGQK